MNIDRIIEKYNYSSYLSTILRKLYPILVEYFLDEKLVFNALNSTPIVLSKDVYECMKQNNMLGAIDSGAVVDEDVLRRAVGGYICEPVFSYNGTEKKYELKKMNRMIALNISRLKSSDKIFVIIHEICHMIKSYHNECTIKKDTAIVHSGLIKWYYHLDNDNGKVKRTLISENGVGLEEGLNAITEDIITSRYLDREVNSPGYVMTKDISKKLFKYGFEDLEEIVLEAQLNHDESKLQKTLGIGYFYFMEFMDKVYKINLDFNKSRTFKEKERIADNLINLVTDEYMPIRKMFLNKLDENKGIKKELA